MEQVVTFCEERGLVLMADEVYQDNVYNMPGLMRFGMRVLLWAFDWYGLIRGGRRFQGSSLDKQRRRIAEWSRMPIGPCRDMIEFHRKMGVFVALSLEGGEHPG